MATTAHTKTNTGQTSYSPEGIGALLQPLTQFEREDGSPFSDGYSIAREEAVLADFIKVGAPEDDPLFDRYVELLDRRERLEQMVAERADHRGADVIASRQEARGLDEIGALVDDGVDQMTIHTIEAYRLFLGRARDPANRVNPIIGGKRIASALRNLWMLTGNDNPYADWALLRHEHGMAEVHKHLRAEIKKAEDILDQQRKRGLNFAVLHSSPPKAVNLGFRSPYGYAISMLIVDFDYFVRLQKTLQRKNLQRDEETRKVLSTVQRAILRVFYDTARFDRWLARTEIRALGRVDWVSEDEDAAKRMAFVTEAFGPVPASIYRAEVQPSHSRRRYSLTESERALLQQVGDRLESEEEAQHAGQATEASPAASEDAAAAP